MCAKKQKKKGKGSSAGAATADTDGESTVQKLAAEDDSQAEYEPIEDATERMEGAVDNTATEFAGIRTGAHRSGGVCFALRHVARAGAAPAVAHRITHIRHPAAHNACSTRSERLCAMHASDACLQAACINQLHCMHTCAPGTFVVSRAALRTCLSRCAFVCAAGRAQPAMLDTIKVEYYGVETPLNQMSGVSAPNADTLLIQPYDTESMPAIEKAIQASNLGLNPSNDGSVIRIKVPQLTEERRKEMVKFANDKAEQGKVAVRNVRTDVMKKVGKTAKKLNLSDDDRKLMEEEVQQLTDKFVKEIDDLLKKKEKELTTM